MYRFGFVLEQTLGHVAHGLNLERALRSEPDIQPELIRIGFTDPVGVQRLPGLRTWSWRASVTARNALRDRLREGRSMRSSSTRRSPSLLATEIMRSVPTVVSLDATPRLFDREGEAYGHRRNPEMVEMVKRRVNMRAFASAARLVTWCQWAAYSLVADYGVQPRQDRRHPARGGPQPVQAVTAGQAVGAGAHPLRRRAVRAEGRAMSCWKPRAAWGTRSSSIS